ncbi:MAG: hypothetical protein OK457_03295 [Thaumarchaeota archaeon]|nr:hypothetical protein [Nitrososphaerota archaeon]
MSWQKYFKTSLVDACEPPENHERFAFSNGQRHPGDSGKEISLLLEKIGNRDVEIDACLPLNLHVT